MSDRSPIAILGVRFDNVTLAGTIARIEEMIASRRPHYIATANIDFLVQARADAELRRILFDAPLILCDGTPLVWASRWLGNPLPERVAGSDLVPRLLGVAAEKGYRIFFLGGREEVLRDAVENVRAKHPRIEIAGHLSPPFAPLHAMDHAAIRREIVAAKPDLLFVSFGCPKQEKWIAMNYRELGVPVCIGVGATVDFLAGAMKRAPLWMQRCGLEWLFRLLQEPRRLARRYFHDMLVFGAPFLRQWLMLRPGGAIDSTAIGVLMAQARAARENCTSPAAPPESAGAALRLMKVQEFFEPGTIGGVRAEAVRDCATR